MDTNTMQKLKEARHYMEQQEYQRAKAILTKLNSPVAKKWLAQIDDLPPEKPKNEKSKEKPKNEDVLAQLELFETNVAYSGGARPNVGSPKHPFALLVVGFLFGAAPGASLCLSMNWGQLGHRRWGLITSFVNLAFVILEVVLVFGVMNGILNEIPTAAFHYLVALLTTFGMHCVFSVGLAAIQYPAYRKKADGALLSMLNHNYRFNGLAIAIIVLGILTFSGSYLALQPYFSPHTYTYGAISVTLPAFWQYYPEPCESTDEFTCLESWVKYEGSQFIYISLIRYQPNIWTDPIVMEETKRETYVVENPESIIRSIQDLSLDGYPARIRETIDGEGECADYTRRVYMIGPDTAYHMTIFFTCERLWVNHYQETSDIIAGIRFQ